MYHRLTSDSQLSHLGLLGARMAGMQQLSKPFEIFSSLYILRIHAC